MLLLEMTMYCMLLLVPEVTNELGKGSALFALEVSEMWPKVEYVFYSVEVAASPALSYLWCDFNVRLLDVLQFVHP